MWENNLASIFKGVLNTENGIMQTSILLFSYVTEILKISQDNVKHNLCSHWTEWGLCMFTDYEQGLHFYTYW